MKAVDFDTLESTLMSIAGIRELKKNTNTVSPLDVNYEFEYNNKVYILYGVAKNRDFGTGNYHTFPGVLQLQEKDVVPRYLENVRKNENNSTTIKHILNEKSYVPEYDVTNCISKPKLNNMPIIPKESLVETLLYWLNNPSGLDNRVNYKMDELTKQASDEINKMTEDFLKKNNISFKPHSGNNNCSNFRRYEINEEEEISPLTYNNGGIYK